MGRLDGRVAFITGAAHGQGRAIAAKFAAEGADLVLSDICEQIETVPYAMGTREGLEHTASLVTGAGRRCIAEPVDVRDEAALKALAERAVEELGGIDVLCANAGVVSFHAYDEMDMKVWDDLLAVNLTGVFKTVRAVAPAMVERKRGSVIITGSSNSREAGKEMPHYVAAKHGVLGLMRNFALELGPQGIRCNLILPGPICTPMADNDPTRVWMFKRDDATLDDYLAATRNWQLLRGRPALPATAIADTAIWLASDESEHVTGAEIPVDAGHLVLPGMNPEPVEDPDLGNFDYDATALGP